MSAPTGLQHLHWSLLKERFPVSASAENAAKVPLPEPLNSIESLEWVYHMRRQMQEIVPGLYLGPYASVIKDNLPEIQKHGITHIVCIRSAAEAYFIRENFKSMGIIYLTIEVEDNDRERLIPYFSKVNQFIESAISAGGKVLVHGNGGTSRSAAFVIAAVMYIYRVTSLQAIRIVQARRFCISPSENFRQQLLEYEPILLAKPLPASSLAEEGDIDEMKSELPNVHGTKRPMEEDVEEGHKMEY